MKNLHFLSLEAKQRKSGMLNNPFDDKRNNIGLSLSRVLTMTNTLLDKKTSFDEQNNQTICRRIRTSFHITCSSKNVKMSREEEEEEDERENTHSTKST